MWHTALFQMSFQKKVHFPHLWTRCAYAAGSIVESKTRFMGNEKSLLTLDAFTDTYALVIHKMQPSRDRQRNQFPTYPMP